MDADYIIDTIVSQLSNTWDIRSGLFALAGTVIGALVSGVFGMWSVNKQQRSYIRTKSMDRVRELYQELIRMTYPFLHLDFKTQNGPSVGTFDDEFLDDLGHLISELSLYASGRMNSLLEDYYDKVKILNSIWHVEVPEYEELEDLENDELQRKSADRDRQIQILELCHEALVKHKECSQRIVDLAREELYIS